MSFRNSKGQIETVTASFNGATVTLATDMAYLPMGRSTGWISGTGGGVNNQADTCGCLTMANPGTLYQKAYLYDANRNLGQVAAQHPWQNQTFTYDAQNRLSVVETPSSTTEFTYDKVGNIQTWCDRYEDDRIMPQVWGYGYLPGTNLLDTLVGYGFSYRLCRVFSDHTTCQTFSSVGSLSYAYDNAGRRTSKTLSSGSGALVDTYIYNQNGRLSAVIRDGEVVGAYTYNGMGQRLTKQANSITTVFHYDFEGNIIATGSPAGDFTSEFIYLGMNRLAMVSCDTGTFYYFMNDQIGTPQMMTDDTGAVVWEARYTPFGATTATVSSGVINNFRFAGQYYDQETGLHYNYHRYYDPSVGRYLSPDPIGLNGGINLYAYVQNNPVNMIDPDGKFPVWVAAGALIGGGINLGATYIANDGHISIRQGLASFTSGAIAGAIGSLSGPLGGTIARSIGFSARGVGAIGASGLISGGAGYTGQVAANAIDPCHQSDPFSAALWGSVGGGIGKAMPTNTLNSIAQANYFAPTTIQGLFKSTNSAWFWGATLTSSSVGAASNWGAP